jgi:hypothetical protein
LFTNATHLGHRPAALIGKPPPQVMLASHREGGLGLEEFARCPVCGQETQTTGHEGVIVHLLAIHSDGIEARWIMKQLGLLVLEPSG